MTPRDLRVLEDLQMWLDDGGAYTGYILALSKMRDQEIQMRNFLHSIVDRSQYPEVDDWLWVERMSKCPTLHH